MKHLARLLSLLVLVSAGFFFTNCGGGGGGDDKSEQEIQYEKLKGLWTVDNVTLAGSAEDWSAKYDGATLNLEDGSFSENKTYNYTMSVQTDVFGPWPETEQWKFGSDPSNDIVRLDNDGEVEMEYTVTDTQLTLTFTYTGSGYDIEARTQSVGGVWTFVFTK